MVAVWEQRNPALTTTLVQRLVRQDERYVIDETVDALLAALSDEALVPQAATPEPMSPPLPAISPHIGVEYQDITPDVAAENDLPVDYGAYVLTVESGGPASNAGIGAGYIILAIGDQHIDAQTPFAEASFQWVTGHDRSRHARARRPRAPS